MTKKLSEVVPLPHRVLNYWLALEALNPRIFSDRKLDWDMPDRKAGSKKVATDAAIPVDISNASNPTPLPWETIEHSIGALFSENEIKEGAQITWTAPVLLFDMKVAGKKLSGLFDEFVKSLPEELDIDVREVEREISEGYAVLATVGFDHQGKLKAGSAQLSSFGWACGQLLAGKYDQLHTFPEVEKSICEKIELAFQKSGGDGFRSGLTFGDFKSAQGSFLRNCLGLDYEQAKTLGAESPSHFRRVASGLSQKGKEDGATGFSDSDILNSFYLGSLHSARTSIDQLAGSLPLPQYLQPAAVGKEGVDVLEDPRTLESMLNPSRFPLARWPAPDPISLVTLQQAAVNSISTNLGSEGLLSVNGPPGTGKTTLIKDIVADVIVSRALELAKFDTPSKAFTSSGETVTSGSYTSRIFKLDSSLRGFGIVVASQNNAAVQNISRELPRKSTISTENLEQGNPFGYFDTLAKNLPFVSEAWGLVAAELGSSDKCHQFVERVWWGSLEKDDKANKSQKRGPSLQAYLSAIGKGGQMHDYVPERLLKRPQLQTEWRKAREDFRQAVQEAEQFATNIGIQCADVRNQLDIIQATRFAEKDVENTESNLSALRSRLENAREQEARQEKLYLAVNQNLQTHESKLLSSLMDVVSPRGKTLRQQAEEAHRNWQDLINEMGSLKQEISDEEAALKRQRTVLQSCRDDETRARISEKVFQEKGLSRFLDPDFWAGDFEELHVAVPWEGAEWKALRDRVFFSAMRLHEAFIEAASSKVLANLSLMMNHLKGKPVSSDANKWLGDIWDTFFLLVPVISTTFASFARLFRNTEPELIGWLIVDEAGQAVPQAAAGALLASKRAVIVGDPLQLEPIETVPEGIRRALAARYDIKAEQWAGYWSSVQTISDRSSAYQSDIGGRKVGFPLLVHRRCQEPMFSIANDVAYAGLMVFAAQDTPSRYLSILPDSLRQSSWINVEGSARKFSVNEGKIAVHLLETLLAKEGEKLPDIYFISPFRDVANRLRTVLRGALGRAGVPRDAAGVWSGSNVGTIHTFQGKEAEVVCLVLGASADAAARSRSWAGARPNILNVAATRAKKLLFVVGSHHAWSQAGVFSTAAEPHRLPIIEAELLIPELVQKESAD